MPRRPANGDAFAVANSRTVADAAAITDSVAVANCTAVAIANAGTLTLPESRDPARMYRRSSRDRALQRVAGTNVNRDSAAVAVAVAVADRRDN
ncbi:MAG: hypothetical protein ACR2PL_12445 [Dehalococcoidia bacterium]